MNENTAHSSSRTGTSRPPAKTSAPLAPITSAGTSTRSTGATPRPDSQPPSQLPGALTRMMPATAALAPARPRPRSSRRKVGSQTIMAIHCSVYTAKQAPSSQGVPQPARASPPSPCLRRVASRKRMAHEKVKHRSARGTSHQPPRNRRRHPQRGEQQHRRHAQRHVAAPKAERQAQPPFLPPRAAAPVRRRRCRRSPGPRRCAIPAAPRRCRWPRRAASPCPGQAGPARARGACRCDRRTARR